MFGMQKPLSRSAVRHIRLGAMIPFVFAILGCSIPTRHEVLTFFFTGVPPLEEKQTERKTAVGQSAQAKEKPAQTSPKDRKTNPPGLQEPMPAVPNVPQLFSHTVWASGDCAACHEGDSMFGFQPGGAAKKSAAAKVFYSGGGMPGKLRQPKDKICTSCHTDKTGLRAIKEDIWLHNTTARGDCLACHDAHQSKQRGVLRRPAEQLCQTCHPAEKLAAMPMHNSTNEPCLSCHNPHMGKDRHLLIQDYQELKQAVKRER